MPKNDKIFEPIIAKATQGPIVVVPNSKYKRKEEHDEQAWLLELKLWQALFAVIPGAERLDLKLPIGGDFAWLSTSAKEPIIKQFKSVAHPDPKKPDAGTRCHGLVTYQDAYVLWRHCTHFSHNSRGGGEDTGKRYDAMEAYELRAALVAKAKIS